MSMVLNLKLSNLAFLVLVLSVYYISESGATRWACGGNQCVCSRLGSHLPVDDNADIDIDVTCHVTTMTSYRSVLTTLPAGLVSLSVLCSDSNSPSFLRNELFEKYPFLQRLVIDKCNISFIDNNFGKSLQNLTALIFSKCSFPEFKTDTFSSCQTLNFLKIVLSKLVNFPFVSDMEDLQTLNISHNIIDNQEMYIPGNRNTTLLSLTTVDISSNNITKLHPEFFPLVPNVQDFVLRSNAISRLSVPRDFTFHDLQRFDATGNPLQGFDFGSFISSKSLTRLSITGSHGASFLLEGVHNLQNLSELKISNFNLNNTVWHALKLPAMERLDFSENSIDRIDLGGMGLLRIIWLQENCISALSAEVFANQSELLSLNLSRNHLSELPDTVFSANQKLVVLDLSGNQIASLNMKHFSSNPKLKLIDLSRNNISKLSYSVFSKVPLLLYLYLQENHLEHLPSLSKLKYLHTLNISHNDLSNVYLRGLNSLTVLYANDNHLQYLSPGLLSPCPNMLMATFDNNQISFIGSLESHPSLALLQLTNNSLKDFPSSSPFARLKSLLYIFLDDNEFTTIQPNMFPPTTEIISMSNNHINTLLFKSLDNLPNLLNLNLMSSHYVMSIQQGSVQRYNKDSHRPSINLGFSDLRCNCWLGYLKVWDEHRDEITELNTRFPKFEGLENTYCVSPFFTGEVRRFKSVPLSQFVCQYTHEEPLCFDFECRCCRTANMSDCPCWWTCPLGCECFQGGNSYYKTYGHINCQRRNFTVIPDLIPSIATHIYLDGNFLGSISKSYFSNFTHTEELHLNHSNIQTIEDGSFDQMIGVQVLYLNDNLLSYIRSGTFGHIPSLTSLDLSQNKIYKIAKGSFDGLSNLQVLNLHNNRMETIGNVLDISTLRVVSLASNPWSCDCSMYSNILTYLLSLGSKVRDRELVCCQFEIDSPQKVSPFFHNASQLLANNVHNSSIVKWNKLFPGIMHDENRTSMIILEQSLHHSDSVITKGETETLAEALTDSNSIGQRGKQHNLTCVPLLLFDFEVLCHDNSNNITKNNMTSGIRYDEAYITPIVIVILVVVTSVLLVMAVLVVVIIWRRRELQALLYAKIGVRIFDDKAAMDKQEEGSKPFDAFISYSQGDHQFVCDALVPNLEKKRYRVCVHYRDFPVGGEIHDVIKRAIHLSSRTILIVSRNFLRSNWCRYEFQTAHRYILKEGSHRLILVLVEDILSEDLDPDFKAHLKTTTYLKAQDTLFWQKLHFALPPVPDSREAQTELELVTRGMKILNARGVGDGDGVGDRDGVGGVGDENGVSSDTSRETKDGGSQKTKKCILDGSNKGKIDWKKEAEKIRNERKERENDFRYYIDNSDTNIFWHNKLLSLSQRDDDNEVDNSVIFNQLEIRPFYVNKGFELESDCTMLEDHALGGSDNDSQKDSWEGDKVSTQDGKTDNKIETGLVAKDDEKAQGGQRAGSEWLGQIHAGIYDAIFKENEVPVEDRDEEQVDSGVGEENCCIVLDEGDGQNDCENDEESIICSEEAYSTSEVLDIYDEIMDEENTVNPGTALERGAGILDSLSSEENGKSVQSVICDSVDINDSHGGNDNIGKDAERDGLDFEENWHEGGTRQWCSSLTMKTSVIEEDFMSQTTGVMKLNLEEEDPGHANEVVHV